MRAWFFTLFLTNNRLTVVVVLLCISLSLTACGGSSKPYELELMPAPNIYDEANINPFHNLEGVIKAPYYGMLYATDRQPAEKGSGTYLNSRGHLIRLGIGKISLGKKEMTWEEARKISLLKNRPANYPLKVTAIEEFGILGKSLGIFTKPMMNEIEEQFAEEHFSSLINKKLSISKQKDIFIYVHGYKVAFDNPLLVATEIWNFLGYDGVFISYAWPSTPHTLAYFSDLETAALSSHNLRILLSYLAEETDAERIHIIGYSAGTRVVINALYQLGLMNQDASKTEVQQKLRIGHVMLVGSDFDRQLFGAYVQEGGLLKVPRTLTIFMSEADNALGISSVLFNQDRLGQTWLDRKLPAVAENFLNNTNDLYFIDVTGAEAATTGNGHAYFRKSPLVSSDILITLLYDLPPAERGLIKDQGRPIWIFPPDYTERLCKTLSRINPPAP